MPGSSSKPLVDRSGLVLFLAGQVLSAAGTYAAIRADLREAMVTAQVARTAAETANARIDRMAEARR